MFSYGLDVIKGLKNLGLRHHIFWSIHLLSIYFDTPVENTFNEENIAKFFHLSHEIKD